MTSSKFKKVLVASALVFGSVAALPPAALAQDKGWYVGAGVGRSNADIDTGAINAGLIASGFAAATTTADEDDTGWKLFAGYQLNKNFAVEVGYADLGQFSANSTTVPAGTLRTNIDTTAWGVDAVGILPFGNNFSLLGRVGVVRSETKISLAGTGAVVVLVPNLKDHETSYKLGLGVGYDFTKSVGVRGEWERYRVADGAGDKADVDLFSVSLRVKF